MPKHLHGRQSNPRLNISEGHSGKNVNGADVVVYSSAVQRDNPEILAAENKQVPVIRRAEMLAELLKVKPTSIAIAKVFEFQIGYIFYILFENDDSKVPTPDFHLKWPIRAGIPCS